MGPSPGAVCSGAHHHAEHVREQLGRRGRRPHQQQRGPRPDRRPEAQGTLVVPDPEVAARNLGFGRIVASEIEAPLMLGNLV